MIANEDIIEIEAPTLGPAEHLFLPQIVDGMRVTLRHLVKSLFKETKTVQYPEEKREITAQNYRGIHRLNRDEKGRIACVACFMCSTACPVDCIHIEAGDSPWDDREKYPIKFDLDELRCIFCGMCEEACPVDAIELTHDYDLVGRTREELILDKEELLSIYDATKDKKPRKNPRITGYLNTGQQSEPESSSHQENAS